MLIWKFKISRKKGISGVFKVLKLFEVSLAT